uniref:Putative coat protein n=1 Tax=Lampyris noctiluca rhabdo-like virus 1 TaxID=2552994 RepID=A0A482JTL9_9RHAB|nr:putative coat protein [Lampyris noctiluca rhabdo-like virus 1]
MASQVYKYGALSRANELRAYPDMNVHLVGNPPKTRKLALLDERISIITDTPLNNSNFNYVLSYYVSRFFVLSGHHDIRKERLATSIAGIIGNCTDWGSLRPWLRIVNAYKKAGINLIIEEMTMAEFKRSTINDERLMQCLNLWDPDLKYMLSQTHLMFIMSCTIILAMTKFLDDNNFESWMTRRILTFSGTTGDSWTPDNTSLDMYPELTQLKTLYTFLSSEHTLRKALYIEVTSIGHQKINFISAAFAEIHHLMRGHEMQHLILIDKYIMEEHPEFLHTVLLRGLKNRFASAIALLRSVPDNEKLYFKLYHDKDASSLLGRRIFEVAATVATTIAQYRNSTFINFFVNRTESHLRIADMTREYLELRDQIIQQALLEGDKNMKGEERSQYLRISLLNLEKKYIQDGNLIEEEESLVVPANIGNTI